MAEVDDTQVLRARSAKPHQRAKSARHRQHVKEVNKSDMSAGSLSSVDSGTESVHQDDIHSSEDDLSPPRDPNEPVKRVDQTIPWKKERPATSVSTRRQRPKSQSGSAKPKNNRPKSCHIASQYTPDHPGYVEYLRPFSAFRPPLKRVINIPDAFSNSYLLQHPNLSEGQKTYLWHTASVYSVNNLKQLQQRRYEQMIQHQVDIGLHNPKDCERYIKYLLGQRRRQFEVDPKIWRNPPRIAPRGRYYHKRDKTVDYESCEDEDVEQDASSSRRPQTAVSSSRYGRPNTSKSKSRPQTATSFHARPSTSKSRTKPAHEKKFPSGQSSDKQLYYDTKDRQLKSPDQREKEEEVKKEKIEKKQKKEKKKREEQSKQRGNTSQDNEKEVSEEALNSEKNAVEKKSDTKKKERKHERKTDEEIETQKKENYNKSSKKKESPNKVSVKSKKENRKDENKKQNGNSRRRSIKKDKPTKEPEKDAANDNLDADEKAIETVQQNNDLDAKRTEKDTKPTVSETSPTENTGDDAPNRESKIKIFVADEEPNEQDYEEEYDDIGEFNPILENRLQKQQQEDTVSVYSSFSVDIPITKTQAPSELEY